MKHIPKIMLSLATLAGISILVAQETAKPESEPKPASTQPAPTQPTPAAPTPPVRLAPARPAPPIRYDYRIVSVPIPDISTSGNLPSLGNPLSALSDFEIFDIPKVQSVMRTPAGAPETKRDVLIYTLRKPRP